MQCTPSLRTTLPIPQFYVQSFEDTEPMKDTLFLPFQYCAKVYPSLAQYAVEPSPKDRSYSISRGFHHCTSCFWTGRALGHNTSCFLSLLRYLCQRDDEYMVYYAELCWNPQYHPPSKFHYEWSRTRRQYRRSFALGGQAIMQLSYRVQVSSAYPHDLTDPILARWMFLLDC